MSGVEGAQQTTCTRSSHPTMKEGGGGFRATSLVGFSSDDDRGYQNVRTDEQIVSARCARYKRVVWNDGTTGRDSNVINKTGVDEIFHCSSEYDDKWKEGGMYAYDSVLNGKTRCRMPAEHGWVLGGQPFKTSSFPTKSHACWNLDLQLTFKGHFQ